MKKYYTTFLFFTYRPGSKLEDAFLEYLNENYCRILITEDNLIRYRKRLVSLGYTELIEKNKKTCIEDNAEKAEKWDTLDADIGEMAA